MSRMKYTLTALSFFMLFLPMNILAQRPNKALLLYGGDDHKTFLGCLNCSDTSRESVCNSVGRFGSSVARDSIWNDVGHYGSEVSRQSPWNETASDVPIVVDGDGKSYGYFTVNVAHRDRTQIDWLVSILDFYGETSDLDKTRVKMCGE